MNRIVEYIIRAKDATGAAIKSAKAKISDFVSHANGGLSSFASKVKQGLAPMMAISSAFGMMEGAAGKAARAVTAVASAAMAFGPLGAVVAGAQVIISIFASKAQEEAEAIQRKADALASQVQKRFAQVKATILETCADALDEAGEAADRLLHKFDRLAQKRAGLQKSVLDQFSADSEAKLLSMRRQMENDVSTSGDDKEVVRAEWLLKIAKERESITKRENEYRAKMEADSIRNDEERVRLAERAAKRYDAKAAEIDEHYTRAVDSVGKNDDYTRNLARQRDEALSRAEAQRSLAEDIRARLEVSRANQTVNEQKRANIVAELENGVLEAEHSLDNSIDDYNAQVIDAERKRIELEQEAAAERVEAEKRLHEQKMKDIRLQVDAELKASEQAETSAQSRLANAKAAVSQAWGWYKDKSSMQREIDAYNQQKAAEVQWQKDFEKLKSKRRDWRDVEFGKLSAEEEAVRQVALAKEEERAAQLALDEIADNTAYLKEIAESLKTEEGA